MSLFDFFKKSSSKDTAKNRLKLVLIHDRANCSTEILEMLKNDIIQVISKYVDIDNEQLDIQISQSPTPGSKESVSTLCANIPIKNIRKVTS